MLDGPFLEIVRYVDALQKRFNLLIEIFTADGFLRTIWIHTLRAMVVGVVKNRGLVHLLDWSIALRTGITSSVRKLAPTVTANDLMLFLGGDACLAFTTPNQPCERKVESAYWTWVSILPQFQLDLVVFRFRYYRLVFSLIPFSAFHREFEPAVLMRPLNTFES